MKIGFFKRDTVTNQILAVYTWKKIYDKDDILIEKKGGGKSMTEVKELKYLGFVITSSASNVSDILGRRRKS